MPTEQQIAKALAHPLRVKLLEAMTTAVLAPGDLADRRERKRKTAYDGPERRDPSSPGREPLGVVSYHVRMLRDYECVELVRTEPKRGALQHFYRATIEMPSVHTGPMVSRDAIVEALREGHRNDSAADQVQFVSELIGWSAEDDEVLQAEMAAIAA